MSAGPLEGAVSRLIVPLVFISGASALGVEVILGRILHRTMGSTSLAVASVLAGFLGGLGLGAAAGERILPRFPRPLLLYGLAELGGLASALLLPLLGGITAVLLRIPGGDALPVLLVVLLAVPWGASFPFIVAAVRPDRVRSLYGWNAIGSSAGGVAAGLLAVPAIGETGTLAACALLQAAVGITACLAGRDGIVTPGLPPDEAGVPDRTPAGGASAVIVLSFLFLSGLLVLYWEVLWTRILVLTVGSTVYSFAVISSSVVLGIGAGSLLLRGRFLARHAGWGLPALAGAALALGYFAVPFLPDAYLAGVRSLGASPLVWGALGAGLTAFLPNFLLGALFPWVVSSRTQRAGTCYAVSSAGSIAGAFLGGPLAAGWVSLEAAYRGGIAGLVALVALGVCLALPMRSGGLRAVLAALGIALAGAAIFPALGATPLGRTWDPLRLLSGVYQWSREDLDRLPLEESRRSREILALVPGREVIVTVELDREASTVYVRGNGKVEGSVPASPGKGSLADLPTQVLLGELPAEMLHGSASASALVIGLGSGVTLGSLLEGAGGGVLPGNVDVIEVEEAFLAAIRHPAAREYFRPFIPAGILDGSAGGPRFHFGDARRVLGSGLRSRRFGAIISQPSEPWIQGSAPLFTVEFLKEAAGRLEERGLFFQWLQIYKLEEEAVKLLVRTFRRVFPEVAIVRPPGTGEIILIGSLRPLDLGRLLSAPAGKALAAAHVEVPADRLAIFLAGPLGVDAWVGLSPALPVNTDARSQIEHMGARSLYSRRELARENLRALREIGGRDPVTRYLAPELRGDLAFKRLLAARNAHFGDFPEALAILEGDPSPEAAALRGEILEESAREARP